MTFLERILDEKRTEIATLKQTYQPTAAQRKPISLYERFQQKEQLQIIAEIKRASPSKGIINPDVVPAEQARIYETAGAGAVSVLTDTPFFKGTMDDLAAVREAVDLPVLNKDFILDEIQIDRAADYGADVILLIVAALEQERLHALYQHAIAKELDVLVEVHNEEELEQAQALGANIIGINNRNLKTFEVDLGVTERLIKKINITDTLVISESGMAVPANAERVAKVGARGILVGETLMRASDIASALQSLQVPVGAEQS
ncbi:indole-3-glycerol phosphate synthase TrpC [Terribacillus halophilus]|jgi:indole-3-glycerol phosphate synthase|uniref:indole-3-glycerol phosphate synthase TrpC n=1 Tax=Terribacillus halophilus TaxID=361279 RepID=UPI0015C3B4F3|nr:indole-3-glycerol phosphate synthase TrpC [Terribacillus halophilus]